MGRLAAPFVVVLAAALLYGVLGTFVEAPSVWGDELRYFDAARSLADEGRLAVRDEPYRYGPLYPIAIAPVLAVAEGETAFAWVKLANALLFALAAIPAYLLARRLVSRGWSLVVAALSVSIPSGLYTGFVLTESVAYPVSCLALLAVALAIERPTALRQVAALGALALAMSARPQFAVLGLALVGGLVVRQVLLGPTRTPWRDAVRTALPTLAAVAAVVVLAAAAAIVRGSALLGGYEDLWQTYSPSRIAAWTWFSVGGLVLTTALAPLVVSPAVARELVRRGRAGSAASVAFLAVAAFGTAAVVIVAGFLSSTDAGLDLLHERYLFYAAPLWFVVVVVWIAWRVPTRYADLAVGGAIVVAAIATLPARLLASDGARQLQAVSTSSWAALRDAAALDARQVTVALGVAAVTTVLVVLASTRRARVVVLAPLVVLATANGALGWSERTGGHASALAVLGPAAAGWVDDVVPQGAVASTVFVGAAGCFAPPVRDAMLLSEFYGSRVGRAYHVGQPSATWIPSRRVVVAGDGRLVDEDGDGIAAEYVLAVPGARIRGALVRADTEGDLGVWRVSGPFVVVDAVSDDELAARACP